MIEVVIVDDSALIRNVLKEIISEQGDMVVTGMARDPLEAREIIRQVNPDVVTLDVEMPKMHGLDFLEKLMRLRPTPVVMISTLTTMGSDTTIRALELGAIDFIAKPKVGITHELEEYSDLICDKIRIAAQAGPRLASIRKKMSQNQGMTEKPILFSPTALKKIIAIGSSTGGTEAIKALLMSLPAQSPPIVITQHMPPGFTKTFADRMNSLARLNVKEAETGDILKPGHVFIAEGGHHLKVERKDDLFTLKLDDGPPVNRHKPSVDVMFDSLLEFGPAVAGVILTGMGADGAQGLKRLRDSGARTFGQDEESCVVYGMPKAAANIGAVEAVLPLKSIAVQLARTVNN
ncbi:protein-glutamate methylesterase/protein-glutamine glutaminase [Oceanospirillum maris]|uniref:protein-glutamate methylesterase/protein-glutamine glutaminase n=1 Tax=Oceanospirillum maris TaxID=64977 RepID=UPI0004290FFD|nr:chemotaxis response regulator protein-glutamate methylesterase [Oceanospirillum maris]